MATPTSLVTGGAGFIGSSLVLELERLGHQVVVVDRTQTSAKNLAEFNGRRMIADITEPLKISGPLDFIFHQAALTDPRYHDDSAIVEQNLKGFDNVLRLARQTGAKLIYASTAGLYGNGPVPMREDQPKEVLTAYGRSKLMIDEKVIPLLPNEAVVGLRYFNAFGPGESHKGRPASMIYHLLLQMSAGKSPRLFKHGEHQRDFIYIKDVVAANVCAMSAPSGIYNVGTGVGTRFNDLVKELNRALGTSLPIEYFDMPYDPSTYQNHTVADTRLAESQLGFKSQWTLRRAIDDYRLWLFKDSQG